MKITRHFKTKSNIALVTGLVLFGIFMVCAAPSYYPCIEVTKSCEDASGPGEPINFSGTVTNCGNVTLSDVTVVDDHAGEVLFVTSLAAGEYADFTGSYIPTMSPSTNTVTAEGVYGTTTVWDEASATCKVPEDGEGCTLTPGYWKTHSEYGPAPYDDTWAMLANGADTPFFGTGLTYYEILWTEPKGGNAYFILAHAYIAAELNVLSVADMSGPISDAWNQAGELLESYEADSLIPKKTADRDMAIELAELLDAYNNGYIGPGHCSE